MARTLMTDSPQLANTIIMVPTGILCVFNPGWLELPLANTIFHGPKPVRAIEVQLSLYAKYQSVSSADKLCNQFGPRSSPTKCRG